MSNPMLREERPSTVLIVDDHPLVRSGIKALIQLDVSLEVCGEAEDAANALAIVDQTEPDMVLVDISLKKSSGLELIKDIKKKHPNVLLLAVSMHDEYIYAVRALSSGANGYIMKQEGTDKIREAIHTVLDGQVYLSESMTRAAVNQLGQSTPSPTATPVDLLSDRELELFELTGHGKEIAEIAEIMNISPRTVEVHRSHIKKKLDLRTSTEIFQRAYDWLRQSGLQP